MEYMEKLKRTIFKEGIPKHITSRACIYHSLGTVQHAHWGIDIVVIREAHSSLPFDVTENLSNCVFRVKLHSFGLAGKVFAFGTMRLAINVFPSFEISICTKQFHHLFEEQLSIEVTNECVAKKIDPSMLDYLRNSKNYLYLGGDVTFYSVKESIQDSLSPSESTGIDIKTNLTRSSHDILNELSKDLKTIFREQIFPDVNLQCGSEILQAHKAVLSSRSPVFAVMFNNPMKESEDNEVVIEDLDPSVLRVMLEYMYCGQVDELTSSGVCELLSAADRYQLPSLKNICVEYLESVVTVDNVFRVLVFADLHDASLKKSAMELICQNYVSLKTTPEWKSLQSERGALAMEVMDYKIQSLSKK